LNSGEIEEDADVVFSIIKKWGEESQKMTSQGNVEDVIADLLPPWVMFNSKLRCMLLNNGLRGSSSGVPNIRSFM